MNRAAFVENLTKCDEWSSCCLPNYRQARQTNLSRISTKREKQYRLVCDRPNKGNKAIERESHFQLSDRAELRIQRRLPSLEHLLRIHE
jgi:hypothetical protein